MKYTPDKRAKKILVTAGPTIENLDPVRYISNYSSGTFGYAIAEEAVKKGYEVCLVSGPVELREPKGVKIVKVKTALEMKKAVAGLIGNYGCIIMAAAVCDFRPEKKAGKKIKKREEIEIKFIKNPDILAGLRKKGLVKIGFALETEDIINNACEKLKKKELDMIVANLMSKGSDPFGGDRSGGKRKYMIIRPEGVIRKISGTTKKKMAGVIVGEAGKLMARRAGA
jgi:phosphopantothenoylcysteine decarboxylase/phosphopantothenate--cysteine ligase